MSLFASTSPSYLTLASLDLCNGYLTEGYEDKLRDTVLKTDKTKEKIKALGITVRNSEPLKITLAPREFGYTGKEVANHLSTHGIEVEFSDRDYTVLMVTPDNREWDFDTLVSALAALKKRAPLPNDINGGIPKPKRVLSIREAVLAASEVIPVEKSLGRISDAPTVSCPPAVPIAVSGEEIDGEIISLLKKYDIERIEVVKNV